MRKIQLLANRCTERTNSLRMLFGFKAPLKQRCHNRRENRVMMALLVKKLASRHICLCVLHHFG